MGGKSPSWNRRAEARHYCFGHRLAWRKDAGEYRRRKGWMNDVSPSGMSFLVEAGRQPHVGDAIEVSQPESGGRLYHVVRVHPLEGKLALIGCRRDPGSRATLAGNPDRSSDKRAKSMPLRTAMPLRLAG
jgi:hypothetical protein